MKAGPFHIGILTATLALLWPSCVTGADVEDLLKRAEATRSSDPRAFASLLDQLRQARSEADARQQRHLRLLEAYQKVIRGSYNEAIAEAVSLFEEAPETPIKFRAGLLVANTAAITRDFTLGLRYLERALALQDQVTDSDTRHHGYVVAAILYNQYGQYSLGQHYAELLLAQDVAPRTRCVAKMLRVEARHGLGEALSDRADFEPAISDCIAQKEPIPTNLIRATQARALAANGRFDEAISLLEGHLGEVEATGYPRLIGEIHGLLAEYRLKRGDIAKAALHARHVRDLKGLDAHSLPLVMAHKVLYEAALARNDYASALDEYRRYAEAERARLDDIKARELAFQLSRLEIKQKNHSIELLSQQNEVLRLQQEVSQKAAWNFRLAVALLAMMAFSFAYWGHRARRTHRSLRELAQTDSLTGLSNRRHFRLRSEAALAQCAQRGKPVSFLLFDLDHFKQINDQCGHASGDWVLREVARVGRKHCRQADLFGRIGGEEFAMALVDCDLRTAERIADECRRSIEAIDATVAGCPLPVSASVGCVSTAKSGYDYEVLIAHADAAMYRSKVAGRNRVTVYEPPENPESCEIASARRGAAKALADTAH